jgi:hypothetical protein
MDCAKCMKQRSAEFLNVRNVSSSFWACGEEGSIYNRTGEVSKQIQSVEFPLVKS